MSTREFCIERRKAELGAFVRVLKAVPENRLDYRPDPKARAAGDLAWLLATEEATLLKLVEDGRVPWKETPRPERYEEVVATFERNAVAVTDRLERLDDAAWERNVELVMEGGNAWSEKLSAMVWGFLFDEVHHRGQLATYLRPMGGKVPAIYGPSADDAGQ